MTRIVRISGSAFPHRASRPKTDERESVPPAAAAVRVVDPLGHRATNRRIPARTSPAVPFLAQYVDQHWPWPRNETTRLHARGNAARAYDQTNALETKEQPGGSISRKA